MLVERDLDHLWSSIIDQYRTLIVVGEFQQLLTEVVAKWI